MPGSVTKQHLLACAVIGCALATGCATEKEVFVPVGQSVVSVRGLPGTRYALPGGNVIFSSLPVLQDPRTNRARNLIGVRMQVANEHDRVPWLVDVREQTATLGPELEIQGEAIPAGIEGADPKADIVLNRSATSVVSVPPGKKETIDFYFPVPPRPVDSPPLQQLTLHWRIQAGPEAIRHHTNLYRARLEPVFGIDSDRGEALGRNWYDPEWNHSFFNPPLIMRWRVTRPR
jgi:hypothetical protein